MLQTSTFSAHIRASYLNVFVGLNINSNIMISSTKGLMYAGMLSWSLYRNISTDSDQVTPNIAAISMICCSDKWFLGSISNINTWLTPDDLQPYMLIPHKNKNSISRKGPLYSLVTISQSSRCLNIPGIEIILVKWVELLLFFYIVWSAISNIYFNEGKKGIFRLVMLRWTGWNKMNCSNPPGL